MHRWVPLQQSRNLSELAPGEFFQTRRVGGEGGGRRQQRTIVTGQELTKKEYVVDLSNLREQVTRVGLVGQERLNSRWKTVFVCSLPPPPTPFFSLFVGSTNHLSLYSLRHLYRLSSTPSPPTLFFFCTHAISQTPQS